jgi:flagellar biosynthesis/type III secretory pathway chaperone
MGAELCARGARVGDSWDDLIKAVRNETALYRRLLGVLGQERMALQHSNRQEIEAFAAAKRRLIERLQALERERADASARLAAGNGLSAGEVTLRLLIRSAPERSAGQLRECRSELADLVAQVKAENQLNEALCRHIGDLLRAAHGVLKGLVANGFVYHRGGRMQSPRLNGKLVCNEI